MTNNYTNKGKQQLAISRWWMFVIIGVLSFFGLTVSADEESVTGTTYPITVATGIDGGKVTVDKQSAAPGEVVTVTTQTDEGYYLNYLVLKHGSEEQSIFDNAWYTDEKTATFEMPNEPVTVTPKFVMADGLAVNMPSTGTRNVSFPTTDAKIEITPNENITAPSYLHLTTTGIEDMRIQLSTESGFLFPGERVVIYDGATTNANKIVDVQMPESEEGQEVGEAVSLGTIFSSGSDLLIYMAPKAGSTLHGGIGMNASMFSNGAQYNISAIPADNGSIEVPSTAKVGEKVTIKVKPEDGFLLDKLYIYAIPENGGGSMQLPHSEYTWYDGTNTLTFDMPASNVVIRPYFLGNFNGNYDLYSLPVPASGSKEVNLAESVKGFVLTADKGVNSAYSNNADGTLLLTASQNQRFVFNGMAQFADNVDKVTVYDGTTTDANVLFELSSSNRYVQRNVSLGNQVLISFKTNESGNLPQGFFVQVEMETIPTPNMKGTGTAEDPYLLENNEDWDAFASLVNSGRQQDACARLDNVLEILLTASNEVGTKAHPYTGTFDGNGNVILFSSEEQQANEVAPFLYIDGATIKDLQTGSSRYDLPTSKQSYVGGIACHTVGEKSTISRCAIGIQGMMFLNGGTVGGLVADAGAPLDIKDCAVGSYGYFMPYNKFGGMVGTATAEVTISNSLVTGLSINGNPANNYVFCGTPENVTFNNALYYRVRGVEVQGTEIQSEDYAQLGKVLSMLQDGRTDAAYRMEDTRQSVLEPYSANLLKYSDNLLYYNTNYKGYYVNTLNLDTYEGSTTNHPSSLNPLFDINTEFVNLDNRSISGSEENPSLYTVCVPFDIKSSDLEEIKYVKAYELSGIDKANNTLTFKQVTAMEAAKPYIIEVTGRSRIYARNAKVLSKPVEPFTVGDVTMTGNYTYMDWYDLKDKNAYILQADNMWHPVTGEENSDVYLSTSRVYLTFANNTAAKAFGMKLSDGVATGISNIKTVDNDSTVRYFDLNGKYVGTSLDGAKSGIYINSNGKKVLK